MSKKLVEIVLVLAVLIVVNVLASFFYTHLDLTEDKRFTLSDSSVNMISEIDDNIFVQVLLDGELEAGFKRLRNATGDMLSEFNSINTNIDYEFVDPSSGNLEKINRTREELRQIGLTPTRVSIMDGKETVEKYIYPYALISQGDRRTIVSLLEEQRLGISNELILNNSVSMLEYKLTNGIFKVWNEVKPNIVLTTGNGELENLETAFLERNLREYYDTGRINLDSLYKIDQDADVLIVARPQKEISQRSQFIIDQYIMNGGNVIWLIEKFFVNVDSVAQYQFFVPRPLETGLDDMFFRYGVKFKDNLVLDLESSTIPQVVGDQGGQPQIDFFKYSYHPLLQAGSGHPIVKNLDRVNVLFPSTIEQVKSKANITHTPLLQSSQYSRYQMFPMRLNFDILRYEPEPDNFDKGPQTVAMLVEGEFDSYFKNRVSESMRTTLSKIDAEFVEKSPPSKQLFVSDADFIKNSYNPETNQISPTGYNRWEEKAYKGNLDFIVNAIDYMVDDYGLADARSKEIKLHLLNTIKAQEESGFWKFINVGLPLLFLGLFAFIYLFVRKRKYAQ